MIYKFVEQPVEKENLKSAKAYQAYNLLKEKGGYKKLTKEEKEFVNDIFDELRHPDTYRYAKYKIGGWIIDFSDYVKTYLVNFKYYGWKEIKAFNKTCIRKNSTFPSYVLEIIEK